MPTWETAADWDDATTETGTMHASVPNTDFDDATTLNHAVPVGNIDANVTDGLIAHYPLQEDSGGTAHDIAGNNDGTVSGATQGVNGILGTSAYSFDGTDDSVSITGFGNLFDGSNPYTLSLWVRVPSEAKVTVKRYDTVLQLKNNFDVRLSSYADYESAGTTQYKIWNGSNENIVNGTDIRGNGWTHITALYDPNLGMELYENANFKGSDGFTGTPLSVSEDNNIGGAGPSSDNFEGVATDVRIYNRTLSRNEIQLLANAPSNSSLTTATKQL